MMRLRRMLDIRVYMDYVEIEGVKDIPRSIWFRYWERLA